MQAYEPTTHRSAEDVSVLDPNLGAREVPSRTRRRTWLYVGLAAALLSGAAVVDITGRRDSAGGPRLSPQTTVELTAMTPGQTEFSLATPLSAAGKEVEILAIQTLISSNVELIGAVAVWPRDLDGTPSAGGLGYPPRRHHPIKTVVPPAETSFIPTGFDEPPPITIALGFRLLSGAGAVNGVTVVYRVDGETQRRHFRHAVIACLEPEPCNENGDDPGFARNLLHGLGLVAE